MAAIGFLVGAGWHSGHDGDEGAFYIGIGGRGNMQGGNDWIGGVLGYLHVDKTWGHLTVGGAIGHLKVNKMSGWGDIQVYAAVGWGEVYHGGHWGSIGIHGVGGGVVARNWGEWGDIHVGGLYGYVDARNYNWVGSTVFWGAAGHIHLEKWGGWAGDVKAWGVSASATLWNTSLHGDIYFGGITGAINAWKNGSTGDIRIYGAAGHVSAVNTTSWAGDIHFGGVAANIHLLRGGGHSGHIHAGGISWNATLVNSVNHGNINFAGVTGNVHARNSGLNGDINIYGIAGNVDARNLKNGLGNVFFGGAALNIYLERWDGEGGDVKAGGTSYSARLVNTARYGSVEFFGVSGAVSLERGPGNWGDVTFAGVAGFVSIVNSADWGNIDVYGVAAGFAVRRLGYVGDVSVRAGSVGAVVLSYVTYGDLTFTAASAYNVVELHAKEGDLSFHAFGLGGNFVGHFVDTGDLNVLAGGTLNVFRRTGNGSSDVTLLGGTNTFVSSGQSNDEVFALGGLNVVKLSGGDNYVEAWGGTNIIETGKGVDHIKSFGAFAYITSGGTSGDTKDTVEVYGAFSIVDTSNGEADSGTKASPGSAVQNIEAAKSSQFVQEGGSSLKFETYQLSSDESALLKLADVEVVEDVEAETEVLEDIGATATENSAELSVEELAMAQEMGYNVRAEDLSGVVDEEAQPDIGAYHHHVAEAEQARSTSAAARRLSTDAYSNANLDGEGDLQKEAEKHADATGGADGDNTDDGYEENWGDAGWTTHDGNNRFWFAGLGTKATTTNQDDTIVATALYNEIYSGGGDDTIVAFGLINVIHAGSGNDFAFISGFGNYADMGDGDDGVVFLNPLNVASGFAIPTVNVAQMGNGNDWILALGTVNVGLKHGHGSLTAVMGGLANVVYQKGGREGDTLTAVMLGALNIVHKEGDGNTVAVLFGAINTVSQHGDGGFTAVMFGALNVATHVGDGGYRAFMFGIAGVSTKVGTGDSVVVMLGVFNIHTTLGDGNDVYVMGGILNVATKVGDGNVLAAMGGIGNVLTVVGDGDIMGLFVAFGNLITKIGDGDVALLMAAFGNVFTQVGDGNFAGVLLGQGNIVTKIGNGDMTFGTIALPLSAAFDGGGSIPAFNLITQVGDGNIMGAMIAVAGSVAANIFTKVGDGDVALALVSATKDSNPFKMFAKDNASIPMALNVVTQIGNGRTYAAAFGGANVFIKVGTGNYEHGWDKWDTSTPGSLYHDHDNSDPSMADAINSGMNDAAAGMSGLLANPYINTIMVGVGSFNVFAEINHKSVLSVYDNTAPVANIIGTERTNSIMASIGRYANLMIKVGDGDMYALGISNPAGVLDLLKPNKSQGGAQNAANPALANNNAAHPALANNDVIKHVREMDAGFARIGEDAGVGPTNKEINGNVSIHVGHGDTNALMFGKYNASVKIGDGGYKVGLLGDGNISVRVGDAAGTLQAIESNGYRVFEGVQLAYGDNNLIINQGRSNDLIVALDPNVLWNSEAWSYLFRAGLPIAESSEKNQFGEKTGEKTYFRQLKLPSIIPFIAGIHSIYVEYEKASNEALADRLKEQDKNDKEKKEAEAKKVDDIFGVSTGNLIYAGAGSDIILAIGANNVVVGDSWTSLLDFNVALLHNAEGKNDLVGKLPFNLHKLITQRKLGIVDLVSLFGEKGDQASKALKPVETVLANIGVEAYIEIPNRDDLKTLFGVHGDADGGVAPIENHDYGKEYLDNLGGGSTLKLGVPAFFTSIVGTISNIVSLAQGYTLGVGQDKNNSLGEDDKGNQFYKGWENHGPAFISALGIPELISTVKDVLPSSGKTIWGEMFDGDSGVADGSLWKDGESWWDGVDPLRNDGDVILAVGKTNFTFGGQGGDLYLGIGITNVAALGDGRDLSITWGEDNRTSLGNGNDAAFAFGKLNILDGGAGHDFAAVFGVQNRITMGSGDDFAIVFGEKNSVYGGKGRDFLIVIGSSNDIRGEDGDDLILAIGSQNTIATGGGIDKVIAVGASSTYFLGKGKDVLTAAGAFEVFYGGEDDDDLIAKVESTDNTFKGEEGNDNLFLGGFNNTFRGGNGIDAFVIRDTVRRVTVDDLSAEDELYLNDDIDLDDIWLRNDGDDLILEIDRWDAHLGEDLPTDTVGQVRLSGWNSNSAERSTLTYFQVNGAGVQQQYVMTAVQIDALATQMASMSRGSAESGFISGLSEDQIHTLRTAWGQGNQGLTASALTNRSTHILSVA